VIERDHRVEAVLGYDPWGLLGRDVVRLADRHRVALVEHAVVHLPDVVVDLGTGDEVLGADERAGRVRSLPSLRLFVMTRGTPP
jgi:hypothetical protein